MHNQIPAFFIDGSASDLGYVSTRDCSWNIDSKAFVENLWRRFYPYADSQFPEDARNHFLQRFWEMYLAVTLLDKGFEITKHGDAGPEFSVQIDGKRVWFEAVSPTHGTGPDKVPELVLGEEARTVPVKEILLRFTNALAEKKGRYVAAVAKGIIAPGDPYILAINSRGIPDASIGNTMPYIVQAFFPIGPLTVAIDSKTREVTDSFHHYRPQITKVSGAEVSTRSFLDHDAAFCSAVIHSGVDYLNYPANLGADFSVLHNLKAAHPITEATFPWCIQWAVRDDQLCRSLGV